MYIDWQLLRFPLIIILLILSTGAGISFHSYHFLKHKQTEKKQAENALKNIESLQEESQIGLEILQKAYPHFQELSKQGVMESEQEQRLYWINRLHELKYQQGLKQLSYRFSQRKSYALPHLTLDQRFQFYVTDMDLDFSLQHSQSILDFIEALLIEKSQLLKLHSCTIQRQHNLEQALKQHDSAHLQVHCRLQWFTIKIQK